MYENTDDKDLKWDLIKMEIRGFTVKYAQMKAKKCKNKEVELQNKTNELQQKLESNPNNNQNLNELYAAKLSFTVGTRAPKRCSGLRRKKCHQNSFPAGGGPCEVHFW